MATTQKSQRTREITTIKVLQKKLDMSDDQYRAMLGQVAGVTSATKLGSAADRQRVIEHLRDLERRMGLADAQPARRAAPPAGRGSEMGFRDDDPARVTKIRMMWLHLATLGEVEAATEAALESWIARQVEVQKIGWLQPKHMNALIEQLKRWTDRVERERR